MQLTCRTSHKRNRGAGGRDSDHLWGRRGRGSRSVLVPCKAADSGLTPVFRGPCALWTHHLELELCRDCHSYFARSKVWLLPSKVTCLTSADFCANTWQYCYGQIGMLGTIIPDAHETRLSSLTVKNLFALPEHFFECGAFTNSLSALTSLSMTFVYDDTIVLVYAFSDILDARVCGFRYNFRQRRTCRHNGSRRLSICGRPT